MKMIKCDICKAIEEEGTSLGRFRGASLRVEYEAHTSHGYSGVYVIDLCSECSLVVHKLVSLNKVNAARDYLMHALRSKGFDSVSISLDSFKGA